MPARSLRAAALPVRGIDESHDFSRVECQGLKRLTTCYSKDELVAEFRNCRRVQRNRGASPPAAFFYPSVYRPVILSVHFLSLFLLSAADTDPVQKPHQSVLCPKIPACPKPQAADCRSGQKCLPLWI